MFQARRPLALFVLAASVGAPLAGCASEPPAPVGVPERNMVFPLAKSVKYSDSFGAARSGGRSHEGQDLMAPKGTVAVAAASGTVTFLRHSSDGLSGNMLRITDADGWQYVYIHMNNDTPGTDDGSNVFDRAFVDGMRQGQKVVAGEPIGYVGDSGNAESTGAHLHFELRRPDGSAANAYSSLRAAPVAPLSAAQVESAAPIGIVDTFGSPAAGTVRVTGWTVDRVTSDPVTISVYVDGNPKGSVVGSLDRPDIGVAYPDKGSAHGFDLQVGGIAAGSRQVCVVAHNAGSGGGSGRIGCAALTVG